MDEQTRQLLTNFLNLKVNVEMQEAVAKAARDELKRLYPQLIATCPHPEAVDWRYGRSGVFRVCTACGVEDHASQGGTPGDEYDYGYPGSPDREFWKYTKVRNAESETEHWTYRKGHGYRVVNGVVK